jgi:hypothetical protein
VNARNATATLTGPYAVNSSVYLAVAAYTGASGAGTVSGPYRYTFTNGSQDVAAIAITGSFDAVGGLTLFFSADNTVASFKYAISTTAFPTLATVQATTAVNGRNATVTSAGPYALGITVYVSAVTYDGASGTGTESLIFQLAVTRQNTTPTIKNRQPGNAVCYPARIDDEFTRNIGNYVPGPQTGSQAGKHYGQILVPRGVTLRAVRCNCYALQAPSGGNPGDTISLNFYRQTDDGGTSFLGSTAQNLYAGWQTLAVTSLTEDTTNRSYFIYFEVTWNTAPPSASELEIAWIEAEYDRPDTDTSM